MKSVLASRNVYVVMNRTGRIQIYRIMSEHNIVLVFDAVQINMAQIC
jgi:hypothetical protein